MHFWPENATTKNSFKKLTKESCSFGLVMEENNIRFILTQYNCDIIKFENSLNRTTIQISRAKKCLKKQEPFKNYVALMYSTK